MHFFLNHNWGLEVARDYIQAFSKDAELADSMFAYSPENFDDIHTSIITDYELLATGQYKNNSADVFTKVKREANIKNYIAEELKK